MTSRRPIAMAWLLLLVMHLIAPPDGACAKLGSKTLDAWNKYVQLTESRIAAELDGKRGFLAIDFKNESEVAKMRSTLKNGEVWIEQLRTTANGREIPVEDGLIHHWFGSIFVPNVTLDRLLGWVQSYDQHERYFKEVEKSKLLSRDGDTFKIYLRLVRKKVVTVHYNTEHTAVYRLHGPYQASSRSFTTRIAELTDAGTVSEHEKAVGDDSGFLWRLNSYWRFKEEDGGVFVECESVSLSRSIPFGLGWLIKGFVESIPRESLEATLTQIRDGVHR